MTRRTQVSSSDDHKPRPAEKRNKSNSIGNYAKTPAVAMATAESASRLTRLRKSMTISSIKQPTGLFHFLDFKNLCILMSCRSDYGRLGNASRPKEPAVKKHQAVNQFTKIEYTAEDLDEMDKQNDIYQDPLSLLSQPLTRMVSMARPEEVDSDDFSFSSTDNGWQLVLACACVS